MKNKVTADVATPRTMRCVRVRKRMPTLTAYYSTQHSVTWQIAYVHVNEFFKMEIKMTPHPVNKEMYKELTYELLE